MSSSSSRHYHLTFDLTRLLPDLTSPLTPRDLCPWPLTSSPSAICGVLKLSISPQQCASLSRDYQPDWLTDRQSDSQTFGLTDRNSHSGHIYKRTQCMCGIVSTWHFVIFPVSDIYCERVFVVNIRYLKRLFLFSPSVNQWVCVNLQCLDNRGSIYQNFYIRHSTV